MATLTIQAAAQSLGTSEITIRRKLRTGQLSGHQEEPPNGRWWGESPDEQLFSPGNAAAGSGPEGQEGHPRRDPVGVRKAQGTNAQRHQRQEQRVRARRNPQRMGHTQVLGDFLFKCRDARSQNKLLRFEHLLNCGSDLGFYRGVLRSKIEQGNPHHSASI